ncbi:hypothetical protein BDAP_002799 [Binucleata daphniae]
MSITKKDNKEFTKDVINDLQTICDSINKCTIENILNNENIFTLQKNINNSQESKHQFFQIIVDEIYKNAMQKNYKKFSILIAILNYTFFEQTQTIKIYIDIQKLETINAYIDNEFLNYKECKNVDIIINCHEFTTTDESKKLHENNININNCKSCHENIIENNDRYENMYARFIEGCLNQLKVANAFYVYMDKNTDVVCDDELEDLLSELQNCEEQLKPNENMCKK